MRAFFVYHGTKDEAFPGFLLEPFAAQLRKSGLASTVEHRCLEGANHLAAAINPDVPADALAFIKEHLRSCLGYAGDDCKQNVQCKILMYIANGDPFHFL